MLARVLVICGVVAAVAGIKISLERIDDLKSRIDDIKNQLHEDTVETRSATLKQIVSNIDYKADSARNEVVDGFLCGICFSVVNQFLNMRRVELQSGPEIKKVAQELCVDFEIQSEEVCHGVIDLNFPSIFYVVENRPDLKADTICKLLLNDGTCAAPSNDDRMDFKIEIDTGSSIETSKDYEMKKQTSEELTIVHFSDIHVDWKYVEGAFSDCEEYACCREIDHAENDTESLAGVWGDYRSCDTPWRAVVDAVRQIKTQHSKIDAVYFTGDVVDHFLWDVSVDAMKHTLEKVFNLLTTEFGSIPIYSILGNHDAQNIFPPTYVNESALSISWLYNQMSELWNTTLSEDAVESVRKGGYYTAIVYPGLRLIALNNNVCFVYNWWLLYEVKSIQEQFQWLHDTLLAAEKAKEKVHILLHIPNADEDYHQPCSREYRRIIDRFHKTISAQFQGHSEFLGFNVFHKLNDEKFPVNVAWNGGSLATFSGVNRNYVVYNVDPVNYIVSDVEAWTYNLTAANQNHMQNPIWFRQFTLREAFNLKDLSPPSLSGFLNGLTLNSTAIQQLWRMRIRDSDLKLKEGCPNSCQREILCDSLIADNNEIKRCDKIRKNFSGR